MLRGRYALPIFFCFLAYQINLHEVFIYNGMHQAGLGSLLALTIAFMLFVQIIFGAWDSNVIAKIAAALLMILAGALSLMLVWMQYDGDGRDFKKKYTLFVMLNNTTIAFLCFTGAILQFLYLNYDDDDES